MGESIWFSILALPVALGLLIVASDFFLNGAIAIANRFRLPEFVIGSLIVAVGTSAPELAINIAAGLEQRGDIVISNLVGSNIVNICLGLGLAGLFVRYGALSGSYLRAFLLGLVAAVGLLALTLVTAEAGKSHLPRLVAFGLLVAFTFYVWKSMGVGGGPEETEEEFSGVRGSLLPSLLSLVGGCVGMAVCADLAVNAAVDISTYVGIPEAVIGATVIAAGGSLPEIFSCISAARRGMPNIVLGNIAGSQIFNLLGILGVTAVVANVSYSTVLGIDTAVLIGATLLLLALSLAGAGARRLLPGLLIAVYAGYGIYLVQISV